MSYNLTNNHRLHCAQLMLMKICAIDELNICAIDENMCNWCRRYAQLMEIRVRDEDMRNWWRYAQLMKICAIDEDMRTALRSCSWLRYSAIDEDMI